MKKTKKTVEKTEEPTRQTAGKQKAETKKATADPGEFKHIELSKIKLWENYRETVNAKGMEELTDSVKSKGVLQPIIVRARNGGFEIVVGKRRYIAAKNAGLKKIPSIVKEYTDGEVLEIQVIENDQREDVNPIEQARGYKKLLDSGKHTHETLAKKLGKSLSYVFARLSLAKLTDEVQKAVLNEKISLGHALVLVRLRHPSEQKEMMKAIIDEEMTVRDASSSLDDFQNSIEGAVFDTSACEKCPYLSRNQALLFPELKKTGECMDRGCYFAKTRDHYLAFVNEKKKQGFKVITGKEAEKLAQHGLRIASPDAARYNDTMPKKYKSECMKCTEHHAWLLYEKAVYRGKAVEFGEVCLNKKCLDAMNGRGVRSESGSAGAGEGNSGRVSPYTIAAHARACRDRFLRKELPEKIEIDKNLQTRLLIYSIVALYRGDDFDIFRDALDMGTSHGPFGEKGLRNIYNAIADIPGVDLKDVLQEVLLISVQVTDPSVLLSMTPEAGIDMTKDFGPDEEFLNTKTKDELTAFVGTHKLAVEVPKSGKKGDIVKAILTQDLRGKHTKELKEEVKIERSA